MKVIKILLLLLLAHTVAFAQSHATKVFLTTVTEQDNAETTDMIGLIYFEKVSGISTEVAGLINKIHFNKGDKIKKNEILLTFNTDFLDKDIDLAEKKIQLISIKIDHTKKNLYRYETLFKQNAASETDYEDLSFLWKELIKERETLQVELEKIKLKKAKSIIRAPFDGIILEKNTDIGDWMQQGSIICKIGALNDIFVQIPIAEKLLQYIPQDEEISVTITAFNKKFKGIFSGLLPYADPKTKNIFVKIKLPNIQNVVENMSAIVAIPVSEKKKLRIIPRDALIKFQGKDFVYTVKENKSVILPVNIVSFLGEYVGVDNPNIVAGMKVVIEGNERLRPNQEVYVAGEKN